MVAMPTAQAAVKPHAPRDRVQPRVSVQTGRDTGAWGNPFYPRTHGDCATRTGTAIVCAVLLF